jgi:hypothetical protein
VAFPRRNPQEYAYRLCTPFFVILRPMGIPLPLIVLVVALALLVPVSIATIQFLRPAPPAALTTLLSAFAQ